jgi:hypothetical protein
VLPAAVAAAAAVRLVCGLHSRQQQWGRLLLQQYNRLELQQQV